MAVFEHACKIPGEAAGGRVDADDGDLSVRKALGDLGCERAYPLPYLLLRQQERRGHYSMPASCFA